VSRISASGELDWKAATRSAIPQVVAQVHDERLAVQKRLGDEHGVGQTQGLVLDDVGDRDAELGAVPGRLADLGARVGRDDDPDLLDAGSGHRLDAVEQDRLVGDRHQLLGAGVGDGPQAGALAARQN